MKRILSPLLLWIFVLGSFALPGGVFAADFSFDYDVYYDVFVTGITRVRHEITLTNEVTDFYARNYTLTVFSEDLDNISVSDPGGDITPIITKKEGQTTLTVPFNLQVVGRGKTLPFTISFDSRDIAEKKGRIWEIIIPGIEKNEEIRSYTIHLSAPRSFGKAAYFAPPPDENGVWTQETLNGGGVTAGFGEQQNFTFNLEYFLENVSGSREIQEITLPPDTAFQAIVLSRLSPPPKNVRVDRDGNWLAEYVLEKEEKLAIVAEGLANVYLTPQEQALPLTDEERGLYTKEQPFWEQTEEIKQKASVLQTPRAIYDWVVATLSYDYNRVEPGIKRLGAKVALQNPDRAACMEFSDLFIATARAAGIPAREIHGFAYTTNSRLQPLSLVSDVLHAWPEYYDDMTHRWIPVDPTWADTTHGVDYFTKLDFNHLAFAILGEKSDYPFPAGSFKTDTSGKDVFVNFKTEETAPIQPDYTVQIEDKKMLAGGRTQASMTVENTGQVRLAADQVKITGPFAVKLVEDTINLPPYGRKEIPLTFSVPFSLEAKTYPFVIIINNKEFSQNITFYPFYFLYAWQIGLVGILIGVGTWGIIAHRGKSRFQEPHR